MQRNRYSVGTAAPEDGTSQWAHRTIPQFHFDIVLISGMQRRGVYEKLGCTSYVWPQGEGLGVASAVSRPV
jgi:hypothetical protein